MKNTFGNSLTVTIFGESHGLYIGAVIDGISPGITVSEEYIENMLYLRSAGDDFSTSRKEADKFIIASGVFEGKTTGTPLTIIIPNTDTHSKDYSENRSKARPSHADFTAFAKYHGFEDYRGGGHFSGRLTAAIVAAGAVVIPALQKKGIYIGSHIKSIGNIKDRNFEDIKADLELVKNDRFAVLDTEAKEKMKQAILDAKAEGDSIGGTIETVITGIPAGVGEPMFDSMESMLSHAIFSVPAVKGIEFGAGFELSQMKGSQANDSFYIKDGKTETVTNNSGGINGGITNGMPIIFKTAIRPTPSIAKTQKTVDFIKNQDTEITICGRHDPCIVQRAKTVIDCISALVISDMLISRFGTDYLGD